MAPTAEPSTLAVSGAPRGDALVIAVRGRIDHASAETFRTALAPHLELCRPGHPVVLDLEAVDYVASVGLRALMLAARQVKAQGGTLVIARLSALVREIFAISKFTLVFRCFDTVDEALAATDSAGGPGGR